MEHGVFLCFGIPYSPRMALRKSLLGILTLVPIRMTGKGKGFLPSLVATLIVYGVHPRIPATSVGTNISLGSNSISSNVVGLSMFIVAPLHRPLLSQSSTECFLFGSVEFHIPAIKVSLEGRQVAVVDTSIASDIQRCFVHLHSLSVEILLQGG